MTTRLHPKYNPYTAERRRDVIWRKKKKLWKKKINVRTCEAHRAYIRSRVI